VIEICLENQKSVQQYLQSQEAQDLIVEWKRAEEKEYVSIPCVTNAANKYFTRLQGTLDDRNKSLVKKNSEGKILLPYFWLEQLRRHNPTAIKELSKNLGCAEEVLQIKPACSLAALAKPR
jgi:hypothetical protein